MVHPYSQDSYDIFSNHGEKGKGRKGFSDPSFDVVALLAATGSTDEVFLPFSQVLHLLLACGTAFALGRFFLFGLFLWIGFLLLDLIQGFLQFVGIYEDFFHFLRQVLGPDKGIVSDDLVFVVFKDFIHLFDIDFHIFLEVILLDLIAEATNVAVVFSLEEGDLFLDLFAYFDQILMLDMLLLYAFLSSLCDQFIKERIDFLNHGFSLEIQ